jgi:hypothetical protein
MAPLTEDSMHTWHVEYRDSRPPVDVRAAYPVADPDLPGWVVFKDHMHKITAMIPDGQAALIRRCVNDHQAALGRLTGGIYPTGCLPAELAGQDDDEAARIEVALRTEALAALMRDRADSMGDDGTEFYVYLNPGYSNGRRDGDILTLDYEDGDRFGPRLHVVLSGHKPARPAEPAEAEVTPAVHMRPVSETSVAAGGTAHLINWQAFA